MKTNYVSALMANIVLAAAIPLTTSVAHAQTFTTLKSFSGGGISVGIESGLTLSDGMLYGVGGMLYKLNTNGSNFAVVHQFTGGSEGSYPVGRVVVSGNAIYGVTQRGGNNLGSVHGGDGIIYRVDTDGSNFSVLRRLDSTAGDGHNPLFGMILSGSTLYGTAGQGGNFSSGVVFKINTNGIGYQNLHSFEPVTEGSQPQAELTLIGNTLFGTTYAGKEGVLNGGTLFKLGLDGTGFSVLYTFTNLFSVQHANMNCLTPVGNTFYGVGYDYNESKSSVYKINTNGSGFQIVSQLPSGQGFSGVLTWTGSELLGAWYDSDYSGGIFQVNANGAGYHVLKTFGTNTSSLVVDLLFDGTMVYGNAFDPVNNDGTVFSLDVRPQLAIASTGANVKLSWPSYAQDYQLEQSPTLAQGSWTNVLTAPSDDGTNQSITFSPGPGNRLFRLHKP